MKLKLLLLFIACSTVFFVASHHTLAAASKPITFNGITITPSIKNLTLQKGQPSNFFDIRVTNTTNSAVSLKVSSVDFKSLNETGGLAFVGSNASQIDHKYGLANWLFFSVNNLQLKPGESKTETVTIDNRDDLTPGGHYAAVLFNSAGSNATTKTNSVAVNQVVSSLVFVRKIGGEIYGLKLNQSIVSNSFFKLPDNLDLFFQNNGNTQEFPRGLITITGPNGREVSRGQINADSALLLPDSTRLYRTGLFSTGRAWLPGKYHVKITYHPDGVNSTYTSDATFFFLNGYLIGEVLIGLILLIYSLIRLRRLIIRYITKKKYHEIKK